MRLPTSLPRASSWLQLGLVIVLSLASGYLAARAGLSNLIVLGVIVGLLVVVLANLTLLLVALPLLSMFLVPTPIPGISLERMIAAFLILAWVLKFLKDREYRLLFPRSILVGLAAFMGAVFVSYHVAPSPSAWLVDGVIYWANRFIYLVLIFDLVDSAKQSKIIIKAIAYGSLLLASWVMPAVIVICGSLTSLRTDIDACRDRLLVGNYFTDIVAYLNTHAFTFAIGIVFFWILFLNEDKQGEIRRVPVHVLVYTAILLIGIIGYANSRRGLLFLIPTLIFIVWALRTLKLDYRLIVVGGLMILVIVENYLNIDPLRLNATIEEIQTREGDRLPSWIATWEAIQKQPIIGYGAGAPNYAVINLYGKEWTLSSTIMDIAYELGAIGTVAILFIFMAIGLYILKKVAPLLLKVKETGGPIPIGLGALPLFGIILIALVLSNSLQNIFPWYIMGLMLAWLKVEA